MSSKILRSLRGHTVELARRFKLSFIAFMILFVVLLVLPADLPSLLANPQTAYVPITAIFVARIKLDMVPPAVVLISNSLNDGPEVYVSTSAVLALISCSPVIFFELVKFIGPTGGDERRIKLIDPFATLFSALFIFGSLFGYFVVAKIFILGLFQPIFPGAGATPYVDVADFYFLIFRLVIMTGVAFTMPVYVISLIRFDARWIRAREMTRRGPMDLCVEAESGSNEGI